MIPQVPADGISKRYEYDNLKCYHVSCDCGDDDHSHIISIESIDNEVMVNIYTTQFTDQITRVKERYDIDNPILQNIDWTWKGLFNSLVTKLSLTLNIWFRNRIEYQAEIILKKQQALNYATALMNAINDMSKDRTVDD